MDLKNFLASKYSSDDFKKFLQERFYNFEILSTNHTDEDLSDSEKKHIQSYRYLGSVELDDSKEIGFFEFLSTAPNIENKRVGFNAILKKLADEYSLDGAIASFYHPDSNAWRLSFIGFEFDEGKAIVTNLKRYTYVLGDGIPIKTAYMQLKNLKYPTFEELKEIFSVERVTKEFYEKYRNLFEKILNELKDLKYLNEKEVELFAKKLLGRIIFLYFLQKKGWLGVTKEANWGEGKKDFLYHYFKVAKNKNQNFYEEYLKKIFFSALNTKREDDYFEELDCKIPFLNGGLFEASNIDKELLYLDNSLFEKIFEIFNEYNFTIIEDSPDDKEVAIDPEMMGKVFENLLEENYRKGKGAFYTPREIVHYMCQQTIIDNLLNYFENKEAITNLIVKKETDNDYIRKFGKDIKEKLLSLKILDPAIGSGAYPMGLLHEIISTIQALDKTMTGEEIASLKRKIIENSIYGIDIDYSAVEIAKLRFWLSLVVDEDEPTPLPNLYYKIMVGNSLFETINGDDLLDKSSSSLFDETESKVKDIQKLIHQFFNTNDNTKKEKLKKEIEENIDELIINKLKEQQDIIESNLKNYQGKKSQTKNIENALNIYALIEKIKQRSTTELFFYKIYFADVLYNGGFDIVIGNPPYIRQEKIKEIKKRLQKEEFYNPITNKKEKYECFNGTADIYIYFFEKGFRLLSKSGILSFITSNKYTRAKYGAKFREFLLKNADIKEYIDFNGVKVFESATVDTAILSFSRKKEQNPRLLYCNVESDYKKEQDLFEYIEKKGFLYHQKNLTKDAFTFLNPKEFKIKEQIEKVGMPLKEWDVKIYRGILTGFNEAFIIDKDTKEKLIKQDPKSAEIIKPLLRGRDIKKYGYEFANKYIIATFPARNINIDEYPAIKKHLEQFLPKLKQTGEVFIDENGKKQKTRKKTGNKWYETQDQIAYWKEFEEEKVIYNEIGNSLDFYFDKNGFYCNNKLYFFTSTNLNLLYSTAILNSSLMQFYFNSIFNFGGGKGNEIFQNMPIPKIENTKSFEILADIIQELVAKNDNRAKFFENVVDIMVYELYFEKELKEKGFDIIDIVSKDLETTTNPKELFEKWSNRNHKIKYVIEFIDTLDIVKTIKGIK